jgi:hypothetical protein
MRPLLFLFAVISTFAADPTAIGSRRELFVDDFLIEKHRMRSGCDQERKMSQVLDHEDSDGTVF